MAEMMRFVKPWLTFLLVCDELQRADLKDKHVADVFPPFFENPPFPNMVEHVKKEKWNAPKHADDDARGTRRKRDSRQGHTESNRFLNCSIQ